MLRTILCLFVLNGLLIADEPATLRGGCGLFISAEALGWQMNQEDTGYAINSNSTSVNLVSGGILYPKTDIQAGFRVGAGYQMPCRRWQLDGVWTHYDQKKTVSSDTRDYILLITNSQTAVPSSAQFRLFYDVVDLALSHTFYAAPCFTLTPYVGARGLFIREKEKVNYDQLDGGNGVGNYTVKNDYRGVGIRSGLALQWILGQLCGQWSLCGEGSGSLIQGKFFSSYFMTNTDTGQYISYNDNRIATKALFQFEAGLRYQRCICGGFPLIIHLSYEGIYLPNLYNLVSTGDAFIGKGDLGFSGVTLGGQFGF